MIVENCFLCKKNIGYIFEEELYIPFSIQMREEHFLHFPSRVTQSKNLIYLLYILISLI